MESSSELDASIQVSSDERHTLRLHYKVWMVFPVNNDHAWQQTLGGVFRMIHEEGWTPRPLLCHSTLGLGDTHATGTHAMLSRRWCCYQQQQQLVGSSSQVAGASYPGRPAFIQQAEVVQAGGLLDDVIHLKGIKHHLKRAVLFDLRNTRTHIQ